MIRSQIAECTLTKGSSEVRIIERSWGIERCYITKDGEEFCSPSPFSTNHRNLDWTLSELKSYI